jgi:hypothetical protein
VVGLRANGRIHPRRKGPPRRPYLLLVSLIWLTAPHCPICRRSFGWMTDIAGAAHDGLMAISVPPDGGDGRDV